MQADKTLSNPYFPNLFQSGKIGGVRLKNRIVMLPMGTAHASAIGEVTDKTIAHYEARARGGAGLVTIGYVAFMGREIPNGLQFDGDWYIDGHADLVEAVHAAGARIAIQLNHGGSRMNQSCVEGKQMVSSSAVARYYLGEVRYPEPRSLSKAEIYEIIERWAQAARRAKKAGYDIIELHGAHGYLVGSFLSPFLNKRTDEFGGSLENRMRFAKELLLRVKFEVGKDYPVGIRLSGEEFWPGGITIAESPIMARMMEEAGAAYISVSCGTLESKLGTGDVMRSKEGWKVYMWEAIKKAITIPIISGGNIKNPSLAETVLANRQTDFIGLARPFLADPDWPDKARDGRVEDIRLCVSCNECHPGASRLAGRVTLRHCSVNPALGRERDFGNIRPAKIPKRVMIIGGGPGGMEAARTAALRGHDVTLYDKGTELGGGLLLAAAPPGKNNWLGFRNYLATQLKKLGVKVVLNIDVGQELVRDAKPDAVIVATGAQPLVPPIPGANGEKVLSGWDILRGKTIKEKQVLVLGGGMVGCETAEHLAEKGHEVTVVEMLPRLAGEMEPLNRMALLDRLVELNIRSLVGRKVTAIQDDGATVVDINSGADEHIQAGQIVLAMGARALDQIAEALEGKVPEIYRVGDCMLPARVIDAVYEGDISAYQL